MPLTNVPLRLPRSRTWIAGGSMTSSQCSRETSMNSNVAGNCKSHSFDRPIRYRVDRVNSHFRPIRELFRNVSVTLTDMALPSATPAAQAVPHAAGRQANKEDICASLMPRPFRAHQGIPDGLFVQRVS